MKGFPLPSSLRVCFNILFIGIKGAWVLISTYQEAGHFSSLCRGVAPSLAQPSVVPHKPEGFTAGRGAFANLLEQTLRAGSTSHSPSLCWPDRKNTWRDKARHVGLIGHNKSEVTLQEEKTHPPDVSPSKPQVLTLDTTFQLQMSLKQKEAKNGLKVSKTFYADKN